MGTNATGRASAAPVIAGQRCLDRPAGCLPLPGRLNEQQLRDLLQVAPEISGFRGAVAQRRKLRCNQRVIESGYVLCVISHVSDRTLKR
jgi:hypothetical protein